MCFNIVLYNKILLCITNQLIKYCFFLKNEDVCYVILDMFSEVQCIGVSNLKGYIIIMYLLCLLMQNPQPTYDTRSV